MKERLKISGVFPAMITPFTSEGAIDYQSMAKVIDFFIEKGVNGLYVLGTSGEWPLIDKDQRKDILEFVMNRVGKRVSVMAHVGALPVKDACELATHAEGVGVSAISSIPPYYFPFHEMDIEKYFDSIMSSVSEQMPVLIYNLPAFVRNVVSIETVKKLKKRYVNFGGIKESQGNLEMLQDYIKTIGDDGIVLVGSDDLISKALEFGCAGIISGNANVLPELFIELVSAYRKGEMDRVNRLQTLVNELAKATHFGRVPLLKAGLSLRGTSAGYAMSPFVQDINEDDHYQLALVIQKILSELKDLNK